MLNPPAVSRDHTRPRPGPGLFPASIGTQTEKVHKSSSAERVPAHLPSTTIGTQTETLPELASRDVKDGQSKDSAGTKAALAAIEASPHSDSKGTSKEKISLTKKPPKLRVEPPVVPTQAGPEVLGKSRKKTPPVAIGGEGRQKMSEVDNSRYSRSVPTVTESPDFLESFEVNSTGEGSSLR